MYAEMTSMLMWLFAAVAYFTSCILVCWAAVERGRSGGWLVLAFLVTPVVALLALAAAGPKQQA